MAVLEQELALEPMQLCLVAPLPGPVDERQGLVQRLLPLMDLAVLPISPRQKGQRIRLAGLGAGRLMCRQTLTDLPQALLGLSLLDQYQTSAEHPARHLEGEPLGGGQGDERVCPLASDLDSRRKRANVVAQ